MRKIFLIEKDDSIRMLLEMALRSARNDPYCFAEATQFLQALQEHTPDACIIGALPQGSSGVSLLRHMRKNEKTASIPVMMLIEREDPSGEAGALASGANDCVLKPFGIMELCVRLHTMLARDDKNKSTIEMVSGPLRLRPARQEATLYSDHLRLTRKEFDLLCNLMINAGRAVPREELLHDVWGYTFIGESRTLDMHVGTLRQKLRDSAVNPKYIKTVRGVGYRFIAPVFTSEKGPSTDLPSPA